MVCKSNLILGFTQNLSCILWYYNVGVGVNKNVGVGKVVLGDFYLLPSTSKSYKKEFIGFGILFYNLDNLIYMVLKHHGNQSKPIFKFHSGYITTWIAEQKKL